MLQDKLNILVIDDEPDVVSYLSMFLSDEGFKVVTAPDGPRGLAAARAEKPDLITLDLQLPGEWGPRFYRKLRKDKELKDTPVVVVSGIDGDHAVKDAVAFVKKPFEEVKRLRPYEPVPMLLTAFASAGSKCVKMNLVKSLKVSFFNTETATIL